MPAATYQKIMRHFKPRLWLGMTATPDKRDDNIEGRNVYELFDYQIACEIRLQQAMEENLLCPFHYFGITDMEIDGIVIDEKTEMENFRFLVSDKRVDYITRQMNFYGYSGDRVKGLIFCSSRKEVETLSGIFNDRGYNTKALTGADIQDTIKYEDHFTSRSSLIAISKQSRTVESEDVQNFLHAKERGIDVELFVRKNKDDKISKEF